MGWSFTVTAALQFRVLGAVFFNFTTVVEPFSVCQINPQTNFSLPLNMTVGFRFTFMTL